MRTFTISALSRDLGVTPRALRFYEEKKLITPSRRGKGIASERIYTEEERDKLADIVRYRVAGVSIQQMHQLFAVEGVARSKLLRDFLIEIEISARERLDNVTALLDWVNVTAAQSMAP